MLTDIAGTDRAQQCVRDGVRQDVSIGMSFQSARVRNLDAAKDQFPSFNKAVHIVANSTSNIHCHQSLRLITPLDAMMLYLSFMSSRGRRSTVPPAFSTRSQPAAISQRLIPCSI